MHTFKGRFYTLVVFLLLLAGPALQVEACPKDKPWRSASRPERIWSATHPFKAKKVVRCARRAQFITDSLGQANVITDRNGGQLDAFRHAYWMALMINEGLGETTVRKIGERHERGNYIDFRKGKQEDSVRADSMMCVMDLRNNTSGIAIGKQYRDGDKKISLIELILKGIWNGELAIMSKNAKGEYLDRNGDVIVLSKYAGAWSIPKHIVKSDMITVPH